MKEEKKGYTEAVDASVSRRKFLNYAGLAGAGMFIASCRDNDDDPAPIDLGVIDLGSGDIGVLNYAFALEQLESEFYIKVTSSFYEGATEQEKSYLQDIRDHEIAHREFFREALDKSAIPNLDFDFSTIDFTSRTSVLEAASRFEELGVAAYNGAGKLLATPEYLIMAGKIASVEARHAAYIRERRTTDSFSVTTDINGMDEEMTPAQVLSIADGYFKTKVSSKNLPTD